ncbi:MAG: phosphoserine transaminase [Alphaproteobacteria bacterium]
MTNITKPTIRPNNPNFSSGPCTKRPNWSLDALKDAFINRSHRAAEGKAKLEEVIEKSKDILGMPKDWRLGIMPGSDTGAVEAALWSLLGERTVDMLAWESFGQGWATDAARHLGLNDARLFTAPYGELPDLSLIDFNHDVVFTWNGTTSGVKIPNGDWIAADRKGLVIVDATSAVFAMDIPWDKVDVVTWSWQKVMGGEAAHGMLALGPRAVERLENYIPSWPIPKVFRLTKSGKLIEGIFKGATINTPSMIAVEDAIDGLNWANDIGGLPALMKRSENNLKVIADFVDEHHWIDFLAKKPETRSQTSVCLALTDPKVTRKALEEQAAIAKKFAKLLADEGVAFDIGSYRDAPPGLRIWAGATVEEQDLKDLMPWLNWAWETLKAQI